MTDTPLPFLPFVSLPTRMIPSLDPLVVSFLQMHCEKVLSHFGHIVPNSEE